MSHSINGTNISLTRGDSLFLQTVSQIASMVLECTLGYYGGAINGATCYVEYDISGSTIDHYTYTYTVDGDATIAVVIGSSGQTNKLYVKQNGSWKEVTAAYKKLTVHGYYNQI